MIFFNFLNFFAISLEFSITRPAGTERNDNFIFSLSHHFPGYFSFFNFICYFFGIFYFATCRNATERYFLYSLILGIFQPILAWNEGIMVYFNFFNFIAIFWEFWITRRVGIKRNDNFYCLFLLLFQPIFGSKWSHNGIF